MSKREMTTAVALLFALWAPLPAQATSARRIRVTKDMPSVDSAAGTTAMSNPTTPPTDTSIVANTTGEWYTPISSACSTVDVSAARAVKIKTSLYDASTMISPDSAKVIALCAVPGQIGSGEMNVGNGRTEYAIDIIPNKRKTHAKVIVDAQTGSVLSSKQFGGLRGLTGWVRESAEHRRNTKP